MVSAFHGDAVDALREWILDLWLLQQRQAIFLGCVVHILGPSLERCLQLHFHILLGHFFSIVFFLRAMNLAFLPKLPLHPTEEREIKSFDEMGVLLVSSEEL